MQGLKASWFILSLTVLFLAKFIDAGYILRDPYICGQPECPSQEKFKYSTYISYHYNYNVTVNTLFSGTSENSSTLDVSAGVIVEFLTPCEGVLKIHSINMKDQDEDYLQERERQFSDEISAHILRFGFQNGVITEICPQAEEKDWVLNFKRGVLSLFQNSMTRFDMDFSGIEQDIHGTCNTKYYMQGQKNTSLIIMKTKDLSQCMDRFKYLSILQTVRYNFQSKFQTWPVLQSENHCRVIIDHHVYTSVSCRERHIFEPFSGKQSGAMTTVIQNLKMEAEINKTTSDLLEEKNEELEKIEIRSNLLHNHVPVVKADIGELRSARDILKEICRIEEARSRAESINITEKSPENSEQMVAGVTIGLWGNLVRECRGLPHSALAQLLNRANTICQFGKKYIFDALPYIASVGSVQLIKNMTIKGTIDENTRLEWLMSMAMIPRPQKEMIISMSELLRIYPTDKAVSLAASSMVHSYCRNSKKSLSECCKEEQNSEIIQIFQKNIINILNKKSKQLSRSEKEMVIIGIKSLGNMGGFTNDFRDFLMNLIEDESVPLPIRVHTIDAFRRIPCDEMASYFLELFRKQSIDVEIRISSYLQVMRCPIFTTMREILQILREEKINQVASFVWSHLENLEKSSIPSRVEKQGLLSSSNIPKPERRPDIRKFSRNYEQGIFFDQYNAGGNYEANVVMSPDSYIPRSVSLNLTVDMFGESINILELKARGEGFEQYVESVFGPNGPLSHSNIEEKLNKFRISRSANEADKIREKVEGINIKNEALNHRFPLLDFGMKVFGNEISYWSAEGKEEIEDSMKQLNLLHQIKTVLSGKHIAYKKASLFLDTTYSMPTGCGLPMTMNMMGTSIANFKMSGSISNLDNFIKNMDLDFEGNMHPSMALSIATTMGVSGGGLGGTGIRVNFRLHTATALSANLHIQGRKLASLKLSLPHSKQEIFEAKSELIVLHGDKERKQTGVNKKKIEASTCSWTVADKAIGVKVCASYEFPNMTDVKDAPYFIMAGPAWYLLSLEKVDPTAKIYSFLYTWESKNDSRIIGFSFDTPGSKTKRMFNASISLSENNGKALMSFQSADNYLRAQATYKNVPELKSLECVLDIDGQKHFDAVMSLARQDQKNGYILIPNLYIAVNNEKITELAGTLRLTQKKGVSQCDVSVEFQTKKLASRLIGYISWNGPSKGARLRLDYRFLGERKETIRIDTLISNREIGHRTDFYGDLGLEFTSYPHLNFFTSTRYTGNRHHQEFKFNISSSKELRGENSTLQYSFSNHQTIDGFKMHHHMLLQKPYLDFHLKYEEDGALQLFSATIGYDKIRHLDGVAGVWGKLNIPAGTRFYMEAGLNATMPSFTPMMFDLNLHEKKPNEFDISAQGVWFSGADATLAAVYQDMSLSHLSSRRLKAVITGTNFEEIAIDAKHTQDNKQTNFNIKGEQGGDHYGLIGRYIVFSKHNFSCYGQVDVKSKSYSVNLIANLLKDISILADFHLDQLRDIHISYLKINRNDLKKLNADVSWDANRDPSQKLSIGFEILNKGTMNYAGSGIILYPGRSITGEFDLLMKDWLYTWLIKLGWSPDDNILWKVKMHSDMKNETIYALLSEMDTPFEGWKDTSLNIIWRYFDNYQHLHGNMTWEKERVAFGILSNYLFKTDEVYGELSTIINSTLSSLPSVTAVAKHRHFWKKYADTFLSFNYNNDGLMMVNSSWQFDRTALTQNINGHVSMRSPFKGYKSGLLATKFMFNQRRDIQSLTHINLEERVYTISLDGHSRRLTNSMLNINITSPIPSYSLMVGRFGFSDTDRHLVAMFKMPNITIGTELLLRLTSSQDFHAYGHLAIPVDLFRNIMLQAKRNSEEVDFRIGFENLMLGFTGIWHYNSKIDFQYLYKIFTPLQGFEENGLVFKNMYNNGLDSEASIRLSKHKIGVVLLIKDNGKGLLKIIEDHYQGVKAKSSEMIIENFSTDVLISIDTIYYDSIKLNGKIEKIEGEMQEEIVNLKGNLILPINREYTMTNKLIIIDMGTMINDLHILTPNYYSEIKFLNTVELVMGEKYNFTYVLLTKNPEKWLENSIRLYYENEAGENDEFSDHVASIVMKTQLRDLRSLDAKFSIFKEDAITKFIGGVAMPSCNISANGHLEVEESFIDTMGAVNLTSPYLQPYRIQVQFKKEFTDVENMIVGGLQYYHGAENNYLLTELTWRPNSTDYLKMKSHVSFIPILPPSDMVLTFNRENDKHQVLRADARIGSRDMIYSVFAEQLKEVMSISVTTPHRGFRKVNFTGELKEKLITGIYISDSVKYNIKGEITKENPLELVVVLQPTSNIDSYTLSLRLDGNKENYHLSASLIGRIQFSFLAKLQNGKNYKEFYAKVDSTNKHFKEILFNSSLHLLPDSKVLLQVQAVTPLEKLETIDVNTEIMLTSKSGDINCVYNITDSAGKGDYKWSLYADNLYIKVNDEHVRNGENNSINFDTYYSTDSATPSTPTDVGFYVNLDNVWKIGANASALIVNNDVSTATVNVLLPKPNIDVHTFYVKLDSKSSSPRKYIILSYSTDETQEIAKALGSVYMPENVLHLNISMEKGSKLKKIDKVDNILNMEVINNRTWNVDYSLTSPMFENEETFKLKGTYDDVDSNFIVVSGVINYPGSKQITDVDITYGGWTHTVAKFNSCTPFPHLPWLGSDARISNKDFGSENVVKIFWSNNTAYFNSTQVIQRKPKSTAQSGVVTIEVPLNTMHVLKGNYDFEESNNWSKGNVLISYNDEKFVQGTFKNTSERLKNNLLCDTVDINIDNAHKPVGIHYIHTHDDRGKTDIKQASLYDLKDPISFNLTGRVDVESWRSGKQVKLMAIQGNRTLKFQNNFESKDKEIYQGSKFTWNPETWFLYNINIKNKTQMGDESHELNLNIEYPERLFGLLALYHSKDTIIDGTATLDWSLSGDNKTVKMNGYWDNPSQLDLNKHDFKISLAHPSFRKDVTLTGKYVSDITTMTNISAVLEYSDFENEVLSFNSMIRDNSNGPLRNYRIEMDCKHPATNLDVVIKSDVNLDYHVYYVNNYYKYQKSLFNETLRHTKLFLNLKEHTVVLEQHRDSDWYAINGTWKNIYPEYKVFFTVDRKSGNDTGIWVLSLKDKSMFGHFNRSDDVSYHIIGQINDARSAEMNAWRDYDDIKTIDMSSYIRLNHSKLLTSKIIWRPEIYQQMKYSVVNFVKDFYSQTSELLTNIKRAPMEAHEALKNVWMDSKPRIKDFLTDLNDLHVIKDDMEGFQTFLNDSYDANEFYIKNIVEFSLNIIDELSLKNHIESLPAILNEIWQIMGNTGSSFKESVVWMIETIKSSYLHFIYQINKLLEGDLMDQVAELMEMAIVKYDSFIKNLHLEFVSYCEAMWKNAVEKINVFWKKFLKSVEPTYIHIAHYVESYTFQLGTEILDFFYARTNELTDTPFFGLLRQLAQDVDMFWKDIHSHDAITSINKYSRLLMNFIRDKFLVHIPFQKELKDLFTEIFNELNQLQKLNIVISLKAKISEAQSKLKWWYDYFYIGDIVKYIAVNLYNKIVEIPKTAIQIEESHRIPKTNFVFDPPHGVLVLEQKLPVPWHDFNRTPDFSEIAEYKFVRNIIDTWLLSNTSLLSYYYEFKLYTDLYNFVPPFDGYALMTGYGTIVTFDHRTFTIQKTGTYLLASDFWTKNFTILVKTNSRKEYDLVLLSKNKLIYVNLFDKSVTIGNMISHTLPIRLDDWNIHKNDEQVEIENVQGVNIVCNYHFKTCSFKISGAYFSRIGGLFGTMNNEQFDDMMTPMKKAANVDEFVRSWKISNEASHDLSANLIKPNESVCESYFKNNVSPLKGCFSVIDSTPFYDECITGLDPCILANTYVNLCFFNHVPIRLPVKCMECLSPKGTLMEEGTFIEIAEIPISTDVVFIIEAHECNRNLKKEKNFELLVNTLESKLIENGMTDNRYAVVGYGGNGVYKNPQSMYVYDKLFLTADEVINSIDRLEIEPNTNNKTWYRGDTFDALSKATSLNFRPGVSKIFILYSCTKCDTSLFKLDVTVVHQGLFDLSIRLHMIMNDNFSMEKKRIEKTLFGIDRKMAFTSKDTKRLVGDSKIRSLVSVPKENVGVCASLALETNGTLFSVNKMKSSEPGGGRKAAIVMGTRAATSSTPCIRARCECHTARLKCPVCPRTGSHAIDEISLSEWNSGEIEDFIDNFVELPVPNL